MKEIDIVIKEIYDLSHWQKHIASCGNNFSPFNMFQHISTTFKLSEINSRSKTTEQSCSFDAISIFDLEIILYWKKFKRQYWSGMFGRINLRTWFDLFYRTPIHWMTVKIDPAIKLSVKIQKVLLECCFLSNFYLLSSIA